MKDLFTPNQVARAIKVSESSVKRWCDQGLIAAQYTAGGHRRIPVQGLVEFLRKNHYDVVRPEVLGLPPNVGRTNWIIERATRQVCDALIAGDEVKCRQILLDLYFTEHSLSRICDQVLAKAFEAVGDRWECGNAEIYQERRACEIVMRLLNELRMLAPTPAETAPVAIGGTPAGDQYKLSTAMVELVLRDNHWQAVSLGSNLPFETLAAAIERHRPKMFWLSVSHLEDEAAFLKDYAKLYDFAGLSCAIAVGGRALTEPLRQQMKYAAFCDNLQHLEAFAQSLANVSKQPS